MTCPELKLWRLHPKHCKIISAEKTLNGTAHPAGVKFCRPFSLANASGWWLFPPIDFDILWKGGKEFDLKMHESFSNSDHILTNSLIRETDQVHIEKWCPINTGRSKFTLGAVEDGVVQVWTGTIFQTPPGWCLHVCSPINFDIYGYRVMEGILETDWMFYDIWINLKFTEQNRWIEFRKTQFPPLAQIVPVTRESVDTEWKLSYDGFVHRDNKEADQIFDFWIQYNEKKFAHGGKQLLSPTDPTLTKDSTTFYKERKKAMDKLFPGRENLE